MSDVEFGNIQGKTGTNDTPACDIDRPALIINDKFSWFSFLLSRLHCLSVYRSTDILKWYRVIFRSFTSTQSSFGRTRLITRIICYILKAIFNTDFNIMLQNDKTHSRKKTPPITSAENTENKSSLCGTALWVQIIMSFRCMTSSGFGVSSFLYRLP
jgi:hypothetical protein